MKIYVIQETTHYDRDSWETYLREEVGYFTDKAEADKWVEDKAEAENREAYDKYVVNQHRDYEYRLAAHEKNQRAIKALKDAGLADNEIPHILMGRVKPAPVSLMSFESYVRTERGTSYEVIELEPHKKTS